MSITAREAAIISAYTDHLMGELDGLYAYLSELEGRPVMTHEFIQTLGRHRNQICKDFEGIGVTP